MREGVEIELQRHGRFIDLELDRILSFERQESR